jgi:hypothetical protein
MTWTQKIVTPQQKTVTLISGHFTARKPLIGAHSEKDDLNVILLCRSAKTLNSCSDWRNRNRKLLTAGHVRETHKEPDRLRDSLRVTLKLRVTARAVSVHFCHCRRRPEFLMGHQ